MIIALSLIAAGMLGQLSVLAERAMSEEEFTWKCAKEGEEWEEGHPCLDAMKALRRLVSDFFGASLGAG